VEKDVRVVSPVAVTPTLGPQGQQLLPCITADACGAVGISAGMVVMPPGRWSRPHLHAHSEIVVCCVTGHAVTLLGPDLTPVHHGPGELLHIPAGVAHVAVNLSTTAGLVAVEVRTDPHFNDDVVLLPELDDLVAGPAARAQAAHAASPPPAVTVWDDLLASAHRPLRLVAGPAPAPTPTPAPV
jgi:uncharacterized RmlC-like cupin family protein